LSRRLARLAELLRESVSMGILFHVKDPRVKGVTVIRAEVGADLRSAKIYISIMGEEREQKLCLHGLESSRGYLQKRIADELDLRWTPVLQFVLDDSVKKSLELSRLLRANQPAAQEATEAVTAEDGEAAPEPEKPTA
jgi:ribosome-binding factor A